MASCLKTNFKKSDVVILMGVIRRGSDAVNEWITNNYDDATAQIIRNIAFEDPNNPITLRSAKDILASSISLKTPENIPENTQSFNPNIQSDQEKSAISPMADFLGEGQVSSRDYDKMKDDFQREIMRSAFITEEGELLPLNDVGQNLLDYRFKLAQNLWKYLYPNQTFPDVENINKAQLINSIISIFENTIASKSFKNYKDQYFDYMKLKHFDALIKENFPFIKKATRYSKSSEIEADMYDSSSIFAFKEKGSAYDEDASSDDYVSEFTKKLLDTFDRPSRWGGRVKMGYHPFRNAIQSVYKWVENSGNAAYNDVLYSDIDSLTDIEKIGSNLIWLLNQYLDDPTNRANIEGKNVVRGIIDIFQKEKLDKTIKYILANQLSSDIAYDYSIVRIESDRTNRRERQELLKISTKLLTSQIVNTETSRTERSLVNKIMLFRENYNQYDRLKKKYGITIGKDGNGDWTIIINQRKLSSETQITPWSATSDGRIQDSAKETEIKIKISTDSANGNSIYKFDRKNNDQKLFPVDMNPDFVVNFINDFTGLNIDSSDIQAFRDMKSTTLFDNFEQLVYIVMTAVEASKVNPETGEAEGHNFSNYRWLFGIQPDLKPYYKGISIVGDYLASKYGTESRTVLKNGQGNNLPVSQLRSSIFDWKRNLYNIKHQKFRGKKNDRNLDTYANPFASNLLYNQESCVGNPITRSDIKIGGRVKQVQNLSLKECLDWAILSDYLFNLMPNINKQSENNPFYGKIILQPMEYADKKRHFTIAFDVAKMIIQDNSGKRHTVQKLLQDIGSIHDVNSRDLSRDIFLTDYFKRTGNKYFELTKRLLLRYASIFGKDSLVDVLKTTRDFRTIFNAKEELEKELQGKSQYEISKLAKEAGVDIYNESDFNTSKKGIVERFNPTLFYLFEVFNDRSSFDNFIKANQVQAIKKCVEKGFILDGSTNPSLGSYFKTLPNNSKFKSWIDPINNEMDLFRVYDRSGNRILIDTTNMNELDKVTSGEYTWELNPIMDSYLLADTVLSNYYTDLAVGDVSGFPAKHKLKYGDPGYIEEDLGSRYLMMTKRAVPMGGTRLTFRTDLKEGIPEMLNLAVVEDTIAPAFNHMGDSDKYTSQDGAAWKSPYYSRMQNTSLLDHRAGDRRMKTLCNWLDPETGTMGLLKFAEYAITNEDRRNSMFSDESLELRFKKMHSIKISTDIDYSSYYRNYGKEIYRQIPESGAKYDRLVKVVRSQNYPNLYNAFWERHNSDGTITMLTPENYDISTIYGMDWLFGGCYAGEINDNNRFEYTEINIELGTKIICNEGLKSKFIHMVANHSAIKAGVKNLNNNSRYNNEEDFDWFDVSAMSYGLQGNKDHDIDDARGVREMSQLINSLTQDGLLPEQANELYELIGNVVSESLGDYRSAIESGDPSKVYKILGKVFVKSLAQNGNSSLGLANAFAANAANDILKGDLKKKIPFSANTLKGIFQAAISSTLNNDAIMRRFAGMGGVETPSYNVLQYFEINDKKLNANEYLKLVGNRELARQYTQDHMIERSIDGWISKNPFVKRIDINQYRPEFEDTLILIDPVGNISEPIKLDTVEKRDRILNLTNHAGYTTFLWTCKPKNLRGSETMIHIEGVGNYSIFDFDAVRAVSYLRSVNNSINELSPEQQLVIKEAIRELIDSNTIKSEELPENFDIIAFDLTLLDEPTRKKLEKRLSWYILNILDPTLQKAYHRQTTTIKTQSAWSNRVLTPETTIDNSWVKSTEGAIGKRDARKLGIRPGDTINDILDGKDQYFKDRIKELLPDPRTFEISPNDYDAVLYTNEGKPIFVVIGNQDSTRAKQIYDRIGDKLVSNLDYPTVQGEYWNGDTNFGSTNNKTFRSYLTSKGKLDFVFVNDYNTYLDLANTDTVIENRLNYNLDNYENLMANNFGKNGIAKFKNVKFEIYENPDGSLKLKANTNINPEILVTELNRTESRSLERKISKIAENRYKSFKMLMQAIMDRIPSQSLQSCAAMDIIMLLDTYENVANVSHMFAWLQGSDFDIDVEYTLFYELNNNGHLITQSFLDKYYEPTDVLSLPKSTGKSYTFNQDGDAIILNSEDYRYFELGSIAPIKKVLESGKTNVRFEGISEDLVEDFERDLNKMLALHERSIHASPERKAAGLRNMIVYRLNDFLKSPIIQGRREISVDASMSEFRNAIPEERNGQEVKRSPFNPVSKFDTQVSNMSGKDGVGIGAAGEKNYFVSHRTHTTDLQIIKDLVDEYQNEVQNNQPTAETAEQIFKYIEYVATNSIFKSPDHQSNIRAIANLPVKRIFNSQVPNIIIPSGFEFNSRSSYLRTYITVDGQFNLQRFIEDLDEVCNGTPGNGINATNAHSGNISLATDNAKYLDLDKMNNTSKFGDIYVYLINSGVRPTTIVRFMTSPVFDICAKFAYDDISNPNTSWFNLENSIQFILDKKTLPIVKQGIFERILIDGSNLSTRDGIADSFFANLFKRLGSSNLRTYMNRLLNGTEFSIKAVNDPNEQLNEFNEYLGKIKGDKIKKQRLIENIYNILRSTENINSQPLYEVAFDALLESLRSRYISLSNRAYANISESIDSEEAYQKAMEEQYLQESYENGEISDTGDINNYFNPERENYNLTAKDIQDAYSYVKRYLYIKNKMLNFLPDQSSWRQNLEMLAEVCEAVGEMKANSNLLGINSKGLTTNDFDEYSKIEGFNKFVNSRYWDSGKKDFVPFDLIKFLLDVDEQNLQINQYEQVKSSENILHNLIGTAHFEEMLTALATNRQLISYCAALDLERKLAKKLVKINSDPDKLSEGNTKSLSNEEYREVQKYVSDLLIARWIQSQSNLDIKIPQGNSYYKRTDSGSKLTKLTTVKIGNIILPLNNIDGLASFKRLMDLYIIPELKQKYPNNNFIQNMNLWYDVDQKTIKTTRGYGLDFDTKLIDQSPIVAEQFKQIVIGFNAIKDVKLSDFGNQNDLIGKLQANYPWTLGELFWLYNLVTYKDGFGNKAFTKVFEDMNLQSGTHTLMGSYYDFLGKLDSKELDVDQLFENELKDSKSKPQNSSNVYFEESQIKLKDLRTRIANDTNANKIKTKLTKETDNGRTKVVGVEFFTGEDIYGESGISGNQEIQYSTSDYTLNMPFTTGFVFDQNSVKKEVKQVGERIKPQEWMNNRGVKQDVFMTISDFFQKRFGFEAIKLINNEMLQDPDFQKELEIPEGELDKYLQANGFIYKDKVYINLDNADISHPIHEYMHIIMACMKASANTKNIYYNLINKVSELSRTPNEYSELIESFKKIYPNTWKEEALVQIIGDKFKLNFDSNINSKAENREWFVQDVLDTINTFLSDALGLPDSANLDKMINDFQKTTKNESLNISDFTLRILFNMMGSKKFGSAQDQSGWTRSIAAAEWLQRAKDKLTITYNGEC